MAIRFSIPGGTLYCSHEGREASFAATLNFRVVGEAERVWLSKVELPEGWKRLRRIPGILRSPTEDRNAFGAFVFCSSHGPERNLKEDVDLTKAEGE